jgi:hypothetical protein
VVHTKLCRYRVVSSVEGLPQVACAGLMRGRCPANAVRGRGGGVGCILERRGRGLASKSS